LPVWTRPACPSYPMAAAQVAEGAGVVMRPVAARAVGAVRQEEKQGGREEGRKGREGGRGGIRIRILATTKDI